MEVLTEHNTAMKMVRKFFFMGKLMNEGLLKSDAIIRITGVNSAFAAPDPAKSRKKIQFHDKKQGKKIVRIFHFRIKKLRK